MWVDGVQRVVCGVTEATTCQEVVIALAQAIGEETQYYQEMSCSFDIGCIGRELRKLLGKQLVKP